MVMAKPLMWLELRSMRKRDLPRILRMEKRCFEFPWTRREMYRIIVINFAVDRNYRRRGIGTRMIEHFCKLLSPKQLNRITLDIREKNKNGQQFFTSLGFRQIQVVSELYDLTPEDAFVMQYRPPKPK